jgi:hypothetical protein
MHVCMQVQVIKRLSSQGRIGWMLEHYGSQLCQKLG